MFLKTAYDSAYKGIKIPFIYSALQADVDAHTDELGALFGKPVYLPRGDEHGIALPAGDDRGGNDGWYTYGYDRHAKRFAGDLKAVISDEYLSFLKGA